MIERPVPWREVVESVDRKNVGHSGQNVGKPGVRFDLTELFGLDQRANDRPAMPAAITAREKVALASELYRPRHKIENVFWWMKVWRRVTTRYDRCARTFMSAICIAATVCS